MNEGTFTRNFQFYDSAVALIKFRELLPHIDLFKELSLDYCHIEGLPDYVVSVNVDYSKFNEVMALGVGF